MTCCLRYARLAPMLALLLAVPALRAQAPAASLDAMVSLENDGSAVIVENLQFPAPRYDQFEWRAPARLPGPLGINYPLVVTVLEVSGGQGAPLPYQLRQFDDYTRLRIPLSGARSLKITYSVENGTRFWSDRDEFAWTLGGGSDAARSASLSVHPPDNAGGQFQAQAFLRAATRSLGPVPMQVEGTRAELPSRPLPASVQLGLTLDFPKGVLREPSPWRELGWFLRGNAIVLFPFALAGIMVALTRAKRAGYSVVARYEPPDGLTPGEAGALLDDHVDPRDITATLVDLAVRGYVKIEQGDPDPGVTFHAQDYILRLLKPMGEWAGLAPHERAMLFHTFYGGQWTKLSSLTMRFYAVVPVISQQLLLTLTGKGFYRMDPRWVHLFRLGLMYVVLMVLLVLDWLGWLSLSQSPLLTAIVAVVSTAIAYGFSRDLSAKTMRGVRAAADIRGFQDFLNSVEGDRLERLPAGSFEKFLPYAMALGVEHHWTQAFAGIAGLGGTPAWFTAVSGLEDDSHFAHNFQRFFGAAHQAMTAAPRSVQAARSSALSASAVSASATAARSGDIMTGVPK